MIDFKTFLRQTLFPFRGALCSLFFQQGAKSQTHHHQKYKYIRNFSFIRTTPPECPIANASFIPNSVNNLDETTMLFNSNENPNLNSSPSNDVTSSNKGIFESSTLNFIAGSSTWAYHHPERGLIKPTETCSSYGSGDDAFVAANSLLAVADGVGGWSKVPGADPSAYSRSLLHFLYQFLIKRDLTLISSPSQLLYETIDKACMNVRHILGSCTLSMAFLLRDDLLCLFNLGDSGIILVRDGKCYLRSSPQCYKHDTPYQLGPKSRTRPSDGVIEIVTPKVGDILLLATDGLFDNVDESDIIARLTKISKDISSGAIQKNQIPIALASSSSQLVTEARASFSSESKQNRNNVTSTRRFQNGKPDDITILLGIIIEKS